MGRRKVGPDQLPLLLGDLDTSWQPPAELPDLHGPQVWDLETWDPFLLKLGPGWAYKNRKEYGHVVGFACAADNIPKGLYAPIRHGGGGNLPEDTVKRWVKHQLKKPVPKIFANATYDAGWMMVEGLELDPKLIEDIQIQAPLINEYRYSYSLDKLATDLLREPKNEKGLNLALLAHGFVDHRGHPDKGCIHKLHSTFVGPYASSDARLTKGVWVEQNKEIERQDLHQIYRLERELIYVTMMMRMNGVRVDLDRVSQLMNQWELEQDQCRATIHQNTGIGVTAWDSCSLSDALGKCGIEVFNTAQGRPSITAEWLDGLIKETTDTETKETLTAVRRLRLLDKASGTFLGKYFRGHEVDGRVHVQFNQLRAERDEDGRMKGTVSGRYSSSDFNMQNLPARDEEIGPAVRSCMIPEEGKQWLAADYASQEPRLTVHWGVRAGMINAVQIAQKYRNDPLTDFHQMVADLCGISRRHAKDINLGLAYGMGGPKLCRSLGLPTERKLIFSKRHGCTIEIEVAGALGQAILDKHHAGAPFIKRLARLAQGRAEERKFIRTLFGRVCRFIDNDWKDASTRKALNKLIQGSAADQTKETMRQLYYDHGIVPMVTVHDELGFSVEDLAEARRIIDLMEGAVELEVPTVVDCKFGPNWGHVEKIARNLLMAA